MICLTLNGRTVEENRKLVAKNAAYIGLAEVRVDLLSHEEWPSLSMFARETSLPLLLTCRRKAEGGAYDGDEEWRAELFRCHAPAFDYIDLEHDFHQPEVCSLARAHGRRILRSFHSFTPPPSKDAMVRLLATLRHQDDEIAKAAIMSNSLDDTCNILEAALSDKGPKNVLAMSDWGEASRVLYRVFGSLWSYSCPESGAVAPGQVSARDLSTLYHAPQLTASTAVFAIVGDPVAHSASPTIHNPLFADKGIDAVYLKIRCQRVEELRRAVPLFKIRGFSVTSPHKESVRSLLDEQSTAVEQIGACNTVVCRSRGWLGENTDTDGILLPLQRIIPSLAEKHVCIVGSGGAARAAAAALKEEGAALTVAARNGDKAQKLARSLGCQASVLAEGRGVPTDSHVIIQASSVGLDSQQDPIPHYRFRGDEVAFEMIYHPLLTRFLDRARQAGCHTVCGRDMLQAQAIRQHTLFAHACRE